MRFDHFGNAWTDIPEGMLVRTPTVAVTARGKRFYGPAVSYSDVQPRECVCLFASHGYLELAVRNGNARIELGLKTGDDVTVEFIAT